MSPKPKSPPRGSKSPEQKGSPSALATQPVPQQQAPIEAESHPETSETSDSDSGFSSDSEASSFVSTLPPEVTDFEFENGRRYHGYMKGSYRFPNDAGEEDREYMKHYATVLCTGGRLHIAPISVNPQKILDVGCGFGAWAIEMGDEFPSAEIIGTDISPTQPTFVPPNVQFEVDDAFSEHGWPFGENKFDYIHIRYFFAAFPTVKYPQLLAQAYRALKPGGYVELVEFDSKPYSDDNTMPEGYRVAEWLAYIDEACAKVGMDLKVTHRLKDLTADAGFEHVNQEIFKMPLGAWPKDKILKEAGKAWRHQIYHGSSGLSMKIFTHLLGWQPAEVETYLTGMRKDLMMKNIHSYMNIHFVYGRKPDGI